MISFTNLAHVYQLALQYSELCGTRWRRYVTIHHFFLDVGTIHSHGEEEAHPIIYINQGIPFSVRTNNSFIGVLLSYSMR